MKDRFYIDDLEIDLPKGGSGIVLNRAVSKQADMSTILSGYSYTIQLPKTSHNIQAFGFSTEVNVDSDYPHVEHVAKVVRDGVTLFDDGVAVVKSVSKTIEVLVKFGGNKRLTTLNDYKLKEFFPDGFLIPWDYSVTENDVVAWVPKLDGMQTQSPEHLRPAVKVSVLFDMIVGQIFEMNNSQRSVIEKMWLMLPTTNGSKDVANKLAFRLKGSTSSDLIAGRQRYDILPDLDYIKALNQQTLYDLIYRISPVGFIRIPLGGRYRITGTVKADNVLTGWKFGIFSSTAEFTDGEAPMFDVYQKTEKDIDEYINISEGDICFGIYDPFKTGYFEIDLTISFAPESEKEYSKTAFLLDYPVRENLPDMSMMDFIKSIMGVFGLMVEQQDESLAFFNINDVILNKSGAIDISKMLIDKNDDKLEYSYGLTKKNILKYAEDELVDKSFGEYMFTADTYNKQENIVFQSPYAATDKNIPLYTNKIEEGKAEFVLNKTSKCRLLLEGGTILLDVLGKQGDSDKKTVTFKSFTFEPLKYENLVRNYWTGYLGVYADKPRISYRKAILNPTFLPDLSFRKPVYADGNYYMLLSVNNYTEAGKADLELALIDGVNVESGGGDASLKNSILVNPTTPLMFTPTAVALYTKSLVNGSVNEGKLIRELDEVTSLSNDTFLPIDTGDGDAKKTSLKLIKDDIQIDNEGKFIRKDKPDETDYLLGLNGGATFGNYMGGFFGSGARINEKGEIEARSCKLWEFLEVPELRFNRIDVISGEMWNAIAFGLIESVDEANLIVTLKLEKGELSGMHLSDFCRGIFHNLTDNPTTPGKDSAGFDVMVGFSTAYFTPVEIIDNAHFKYELKPGTTVHPCQSMKFAVYGNPIEKNRQASAYSTRSYQRYLINVDTWEINPGKHVSMQLGDLSNLVINGESLAEGSVYLNNVYFGGNVWHVPGLDNNLKGQDAYSVTLSTYSAVYNTKDQMTEQLDVVTGDNTVTTGSDIVVASDFRISTRIQATKGEKPLRYSEVLGEGKYLVSAYSDDCVFAIADGLIVVRGVSGEKATIKIEVNCEGLATYEQEFTIVSVTDGIDGTDIEWIYKRTATEAEKPMKPLSENTNDFIPAGWTDDPVGTTIDMPYEWSCKREKRNGTWGEFSDVFLWLKFGKDGKEEEFIYKRTSSGSRPSTPGTSQTDDYVPSGWTDDPVGPDSSYPYEWVSIRKKINNVWGAFSLPALSAKYSFDGDDGRPGTDGKSTYPVYRRSESQPSIPSGTWIPPSGWALDPPSGLSPLWMSKATFYENGTMYSSWSTPVRITGDTGATGSQGPFVTSRGEYSGSKVYTGTMERIDVVYYPSTGYYYQALTTAGSFSGVPPTNTSKWTRFQGEYENIATSLLFAKEANIAGWWFSDKRIESQNRNVIIDGNANTDPRIALGATFANRHNAPSRMYDDGSVFFRKGTVGGFTLSEDQLSAEYTGGYGAGSTFKIKSGYDSAIEMRNTGRDDFNAFAGIGLNTTYGGVDSMIHLKTKRLYTSSGDWKVFSPLRVEFESNSVEGAINIKTGRSTGPFMPQCWIDCGHIAGWGSTFRVESRYFGEVGGLERTVMNAHQMAFTSQLQNAGLVTNPTWKPLYIDLKTGFIAWGD